MDTPFRSELIIPENIQFPNSAVDISCPICLDILIDPISCGNCLNCFCRECMIRYVHQTESQSDSFFSPIITCCPKCKQHFRQIHCAPIIKQFLAEARFKCEYSKNGCKDIIKYENYQTHRHTCQYRQIHCIQNGCKKIIIHKDLQIHLDYECMFLFEICDYCDSPFPKFQIQKHIDSCPDKPQPCKFCQQSISLSQMDKHYLKCPEKIVQCSFCDIELKMQYLDNHQEDCEKNIVACQECNEQIVYNTLRDHQQICPEVHCPCRVCNKLVRRKEISRHTSADCIIELKEEINRIKEQKHTIHKELQTLNEQPKYSQLIPVGNVRVFGSNNNMAEVMGTQMFLPFFGGTHRFSNEMTFAILRSDQFVLMNFTIDVDKDYEWEIIVPNQPSSIFGVGLIDREVLNSNSSDIRSRAYIFSATGDLSYPCKHPFMGPISICRTEMRIGQGDYIVMQMKNGMFIVRNVTQNKTSQIGIDFSQIQLHSLSPCIKLGRVGDRVYVGAIKSSQRLTIDMCE